MTYLSRARPWREVAATLWLMLLGAGLLATSSPADGIGGGSGSLVWQGPGPVTTLSDAEPVRRYAVTLAVPKTAQELQLGGQRASVQLSVSAAYADSSTAAGSTGQAGAAPVAEEDPTPWLTVMLRDTSGAPLTASGPFITQWSGATTVEFTGDCSAPDPAGFDPCRVSFIVEFDRSPSGTPPTTEISWYFVVSASVFGVESGMHLEWAAEIEPL